MIAGVLIIPLPALVLGGHGVMGRRRITSESGDQLSQVLLVGLRLLVLLLVFALSAVSLLSLIGAIIKGVALPELVYVFFFLDLLLGALVVLTFGRRDPRRARRSASPAAR
jgi:hypothetical protein